MSLKIVLIAALLPCFVLLSYIYRKDSIEKEPTDLLVRLFAFGCLSTIPAIVLETVGTSILSSFVYEGTMPFIFLENFIVVAVSEEFCKRFVLKWLSWKNPAFNYVFDGVVYAVFVSLGFAALENIGYILSFGLEVAPIRGIAAIPLHAICGLFMGHYYGIARYCENIGERAAAASNMSLSLLIPVLIHGFYDFAASIDNDFMGYVWLIFVVIVDIAAIAAVRRYSKTDTPL